jgi:hypothetical protein
MQKVEYRNELNCFFCEVVVLQRFLDHLALLEILVHQPNFAAWVGRGMTMELGLQNRISEQEGERAISGFRASSKRRRVSGLQMLVEARLMAQCQTQIMATGNLSL